MKPRLALPLLALAVLFAAPPILAASKKDTPRRESLVAALSAVSPDPLGGRLGLNLAIDRAPKVSVPVTSVRQASKPADHSVDQVDYLSWKRTNKA